MEKIQPEIKFIPDPASIAFDINEQTYSECFWMVDENTLMHCLSLIQGVPENKLVILPSGEALKTIQTATLVWEFLAKNEVNRKSVLVNLGGGVLCDTAGFAASVFQRGIAFINIPTTLLAMVDAAHGGKTGVDFHNLKNYLGTFTEADQVIICPEFLKTLPLAELKSGWAEILKHALICDRDYFSKVRVAFNTTDNFIPSLEIIERSVQIKQAIVADDPYELGNRKLLNFGHTIGHAIESHFLAIGKSISHGRATAAGMFCESFISTRKWGLRIDEHVLISHALELFDAVEFDAGDFDKILTYASKDKKNDAQIRMTLLSEIGKGYVNIPVDKDIISESLHEYLLWQKTL